MTNIEANTMTLNGVRYVREDAIPAPQPNGNGTVGTGGAKRRAA
jgi:hypothetical protein